MRPNSIILFERIYWTSLLLGLINNAVNWSSLSALFTTNPALRKLSSGFVDGALAGGVVFSLLVILLFWYFIARRGSNVARWIWAVLLVIRIPGALLSVFGKNAAQLPGLGRAIVLILLGLSVAELVLLFRADSRAWFSSDKTAIDTHAFD